MHAGEGLAGFPSYRSHPLSLRLLTMEFLLRLLPSPFPLLLAAVPLLGYLALIALIRVSGRPLITTGGRDIAAIGVAIAGLVAIGPAELFFPATAASLFGPTVWVWLTLFYGLCLTLVAISFRPRLVIYGRSPEELFAPLVRAAQRLDPQATGDSGTLQVSLPGLGIHLRLDGHRGIDHAEVLAFERSYPAKFWSQLLGCLREEVAIAPRPMPRRGITMLAVTILLAGLVLWRGIDQQAVVVEEFRLWLWR